MDSSSSSSAQNLASTSSLSEEELTLTVKWSGKEYTVRVCGDDSVAELKRRICELTNVLPKRQKLLYPKAGNKLADESVLLSQLPLKSSLKMTMIGLNVIQQEIRRVEDEKFQREQTLGMFWEHLPAIDPIVVRDRMIFLQNEIRSLGNRKRALLLEQQELLVRAVTRGDTVEDEIIVDPVDAPEIIDDFEIGQEEAVEIPDKEVNRKKLQRRVNQYKIKLRNPCREGKKLLVLDIDYTLFDHRSTAENPLQLMRPYLHEFLTAAYAEYDIMIWSATSMKWVELKMEELGVLNNPNYKITALLDHLAMITVQSDSRGIFDCKPLGLIWGQFPEYYSPKNTIMFDDLRRNFVMNPQNGLTIKPFRKAHVNRDSDQELVKLTQYLLTIAELDDLSTLNHSRWQFYTEDNAKRRRHA